MKGRGILIAAAVIQLVGAAFMLLGGISTLVMMPAIMGAMPNGPTNATQMAGTAMRVAGFIYLLFAGFTTFTSIKLIQLRKWAWIVSLVMSSLCAAFLVLGLVGVLVAGRAMPHGLGFGELIILFILGTPVFVVIGLLIGGRHAIFAPQPAVPSQPAPLTPPSQ